MTKILLVEDDKSLREIYSVRLLAEGYTLISCGDGEEALAVAIGEKPDLIISDVMMPKISGLEMLDLLRSNEATKNIKVIMLTALSSEQQRERGDRLGADRYLIKSQVGIEDIVRTVHEVLGDSGQQKTLSQMEESSQQAQGSNQVAQPGLADRLQPQSANNPTSSTPASTPQQPAATAGRLNREPMANSPFNTLLSNNESVLQSMPNGAQSAFNPLAATAPAATAGVPAPKLPDTPMDIPARTVVQTTSPMSYASAMQAAERLVTRVQQPLSNQQSAPQSQMVPQISVTQAPSSVEPGVYADAQSQQIQSIQKSPLQTVRPQGSSAAQEQALQAVPLPSPNQESTLTAAASNSPTHPISTAPATMNSRIMTQPQEASSAVASAPRMMQQSTTAIPQIQTIAQTPMQAAQAVTQPTAYSNVVPSYDKAQQSVGNSYVLAHQSVLSGQTTQLVTPTSRTDDDSRSVGGERVVKPLPQYDNAGPNPKINIDELLAENNYSSTTSNTFPR